MRRLFRSIHERGHEIGFHPGYSTYCHPDAFMRSIERLRRVLEEEGIQQPLLGGRQHYLRWEMPYTARLWSQAGLDYDSTLSYADHAGFRCGTCREFELFDVIERVPLGVRERPLIVMDCSIVDERYMGLGDGDTAIERMLQLKRHCSTVGGSFSLLWHNSYFDSQAQRQVYQLGIK
jgi:hypothetical protein